MPRKKKTRTKRTKRTMKKPIGFTRIKGKYRLVFGTRKNPKLSPGSYKTKKALITKAKRYFK